jgi:hypothetical protein
VSHFVLNASTANWPTGADPQPQFPAWGRPMSKTRTINNPNTFTFRINSSFPSPASFLGRQCANTTEYNMGKMLRQVFWDKRRFWAPSLNTLYDLSAEKERASLLSKAGKNENPRHFL